MRNTIVNFKHIALILAGVLLVFGLQGISYSQTLNAWPSELSAASLNRSVVTLRLQDATYVKFEWDIGDALTVSGIPGVTIGTFGPA